jgi:hypothetical protein
MHRVARFVGMGLLVAHGICLPAFAADSPALQAGISMGEVLVRWGAPVERIEKESSRGELWVYPKGTVAFHQGKVVDFPGAAHAGGAQAKGAASGSISGAKMKLGEGSQTQVSQALAPQEAESNGDLPSNSSSDVISDVLREIPSGEEDKSAGARIGMAPGRLPLRPTPSNLPPPMDPSVVEENSNDELP